LKGPSPEEFGGNVSGYYSGHYCWYGINLQAKCNSNCCSIYFVQLLPQERQMMLR
jgi:hypothetical protein